MCIYIFFFFFCKQYFISKRNRIGQQAVYIYINSCYKSMNMLI